MPSSSCGVSRTSASIQRAGRPDGGRQAARQLEHARAEVDADDLVGAEVPERERVATAGALQVDRPPAAPVQVADQLELRGQEVRATRRDELDRLGEPALVALGGLVPRPAVGRVHAANVGPFRGGRGADVRMRVVLGHARECTTRPVVAGS